VSIRAFSQGTPTLASQIPFYDPENGVDRRCSVSELRSLLDPAQNDAPVTQYAAPGASGFSVTVAPAEDGGNVFLLLSPGGAYATGTIVLPAGQDGQEITAHCRAFAVTALTVTPATDDNTSGAPTTLAAGGFFRLRFDGVNRLWCRVG
jgi:hypothetical protein